MSAIEAGTCYAGVTDDLVRALPAGLELRDAGTTGAGDDVPTMVGHFAVFNRWTEIDSMWEGNFMERLAPGSFKKTFKENAGSFRVLAEHGHDPQLGSRALGAIDVLIEDNIGAYYEVPLLDSPDVRDLILPRLRANLYGASFRFRVMREDVVNEPKASTDNPNGLPERTIKEVRLFEFGPVTFPAYAEATAGMRSLTDEYVGPARLARDHSLLLARLEADAELSARFARVLFPTRDNDLTVARGDDKSVDPDADTAGGAAPDENKDPAAPERKPATTPLYGLNARKEKWRL